MKISNEEGQGSFIWSQSKVRTLLTCFDTICDKERYEDILAAILIFYVQKHKECESKNISVEFHAEQLKDNFLSLRKEMDEDQENEPIL